LEKDGDSVKKLFFVMNPLAGTRKANPKLTDILAVFNRADYDVQVYITQSQGDAQKIVAQRAGEMDLVVCCGGDGTFNETVSGVLESGAQVPIGYIPAGSTNDFANSLNLPLDPVEAAKVIANGKATPVDVGSFNGRDFTYVASFGVFTKASYATPQNVKNALGHTAYVLGGIQELSQLRNRVHLKIETEDQVVEDDFIFGAICNSTSVGGILTLDPKKVDLGDGLLEVLLVRYPKDFSEVTECIQAVQKQTYQCRMVTFFSAGKLSITADPDMPWTLDGEHQSGCAQIEVVNKRHAICLMR
jgi:YegS/Rv2252/BmrU family lipid kinase